MELSVNPGYMDSFIAACFLPHTNDKLFPTAQAEANAFEDVAEAVDPAAKDGGDVGEEIFSDATKLC
jgi:hypothetical protein